MWYNKHEGSTNASIQTGRAQNTYSPNLWLHYINKICYIITMHYDIFVDTCVDIIGWLGLNSYLLSLKGKNQTIINHDMNIITVPEVCYAKVMELHMITLSRTLIRFDMLRNITHHWPSFPIGPLTFHPPWTIHFEEALPLRFGWGIQITYLN